MHVIRREKILTILLLLGISFISFGCLAHQSSAGSITTTASIDNDAMRMKPVRIYQKIGQDTFTFDSETITYYAYFGLTFVQEGGTYQITPYVYVDTGEYFVSNLEATLTYTLKIEYNGKTINHSGSISDTAPFFGWDISEVYMFSLPQNSIEMGDFPTTMEIDFDYSISGGGHFYISGNQDLSRYFFSPLIELWALITILAVLGGVIILISVIAIKIKKKKSQLEAENLQRKKSSGASSGASHGLYSSQQQNPFKSKSINPNLESNKVDEEDDVNNLSM
mgnify:CR=1 FL=1